MNFSLKHGRTRSSTLLILAFSILTPSCSSVATLNETAYVVPERLKLKSSTAQASRIVAELKSGDRVTITARAFAEDSTLWAKVQGPDDNPGWAEARYFVKEDVVAESRRIAEKIKDVQTQAIGKSRATLKLRLTPDRSNDNNVATLLPSGTMLEVVDRERKPKPSTLVIEAENDSTANKAAGSTAEVRYDDWLLVRLKDYAVLPAGWIYGGSVDLDIPSDIIYFGSTGRRITGWQKIGTVHEDNSKSGDHYLVLERKIFNADEQVDFDRVKILAYDPFSRNYSTPFREDISGCFPVTLKMEGTRGQFQLPVIGKNRQSQLLTYDIEMLDGGKIKITKQTK